MQESDGAASMSVLPDEVLRLILPLLDGATFKRSQRVCARWRHVVQELEETNFTQLWQTFLKRDFIPSHTTDAMSCEGFNDWQKYVSLYTWPNIANCPYEVHTLKLDRNVDKVHCVSLANENLVVITDKYIDYYDLTTLKRRDERKLGYYTHFKQNNFYCSIQSNDIIYIAFPVSADDKKIYCIRGMRLFVYLNDLALFGNDTRLIALRNTEQFMVLDCVVDGLGARKDLMYARTNVGTFICDESLHRVQAPKRLNVDHFAGLLQTHAPQMNKSLGETRANLNNFIVDVCSKMDPKKMVSDPMVSEMFKTPTPVITSACVYNNLLILGTHVCKIKVYKIIGDKIDGFVDVLTIDMSLALNGILDVRVHETIEFCHLIVQTVRYVSIVRFKRCDLMFRSSRRNEASGTN